MNYGLFFYYSQLIFEIFLKFSQLWSNKAYSILKSTESSLLLQDIIIITLFLTIFSWQTEGDTDTLVLLLLFNVRPSCQNNKQKVSTVRKACGARYSWSGAHWLFWERTCTCTLLLCTPKQKWHVTCKAYWTNTIFTQWRIWRNLILASVGTVQSNSLSFFHSCLLA